ncbi:hypothetical protein PC116_g19639 [Phytophthora cactorum]|nr:hypothetical protein PC116_g19639 [Phytophthora cactorum]
MLKNLCDVDTGFDACNGFVKQSEKAGCTNFKLISAGSTRVRGRGAKLYPRES